MTLSSPSTSSSSPKSSSPKSSSLMIATVSFEHVSKSFGSNVLFDNLNLKVNPGQFNVILGAPASGKSTLLRLLIGLDKPSSGRIMLRGEDVTGVAAGQRNIGYVPQTFALYPHYSVYDNIAYPLRLNRVPTKEIKPIVEQAAERLSIADLLTKRPDQVSGGQKQRVAIARGIVKNTDIFVLDDPLTGLDFKLREQLFDDLQQMQAELAASFIYTTSDTLEAQMLAQTIYVLDDGHVVETGDFEVVFEQPQHRSTTALLGFPKTNMIAGELAAQHVNCSSFNLTVQLDEDVAEQASSSVDLAVRPQHVVINPNVSAGGAWLMSPATITLIDNLGGEVVVYLETAEGSLLAVLPQAAATNLSEGEVSIGIRPEHITIYDQHTGKRLGQGTSQASSTQTSSQAASLEEVDRG
ncbi:MAG: ABC transporter ATP-binding protein [Deinococcota bacterium]